MEKERKTLNQIIDSSYSLKKLLETHKLSDYGVWKVSGEDPNADFAGYHHNPLIAITEGTLEDVIVWAERQPLWYAWGAGGKIEPYSPRKVIKVDKETILKEEVLLAKEKILKQQLADLQKQLSNLKG